MNFSTGKSLHVLLLFLAVLSLSSCWCAAEDGYIQVRATYSGLQFTVCIKEKQKIYDCEVYQSLVQLFGYDTMAEKLIKCIAYKDSLNTCTNVPLSNGLYYCLSNIKIISNCQYYRQNLFSLYQCSGCVYPYTLNQDGTACQSKSKSDKLANCRAVDSSNNCTKCNEYYTLVGISCIPSQRINCQVFEQKTLTCSKCQQAYTKTLTGCISSEIIQASILPTCNDNEFLATNGKCTVIFPYCGQYNEKGECINCDDKHQFTLDLTQCAEKKRVIQVSDTVLIPCKQSNDPKITFVQLDKNNCIAVDSNCKPNGYTLQGCTQCVDGYFQYGHVCYKSS